MADSTVPLTHETIVSKSILRDRTGAAAILALLFGVFMLMGFVVGFIVGWGLG